MRRSFCWDTSQVLNRWVARRGVGILRRLLHMRGAIFIQLGVCKVEMGVRRMVFGGGQLPMKPVGTDVRGILIAHATRVERVVRNGKSEFARLRLRFSNRKRIVE